jgi:cell division protein FtsB
MIPATTSMMNGWGDWRKKHKVRSNLILIAFALVIAWTLLFYGNQQHRAEAIKMQKSTAEQAQMLSDLKAQNQVLIAQKQILVDQNRDLQNDMDALRRHFNVRSKRERTLDENIVVSDSVKATVKRVPHP